VTTWNWSGYAYGADKVGVDAAELGGWPEPTGIKATNSIDELIALKPEDLARIQKACEAGNSTIFGSGAHPGLTNLVGMVLSSACERVDEIRITE
jgi:hypothetical protein